MVLLGIGTALTLLGIALYRDEYREKLDELGRIEPARLEVVAAACALVGLGAALVGAGLT